MLYQTGLIVLLALSLVLCGFALAIATSGYQNKFVKGLIATIALLNLACLCFVAVMQFKPCPASSTEVALQELADLSPKVPLIGGLASLTPTAGASSVVKANGEKNFGGVLIKNPMRRLFSINILNPETNKYEEYEEESDVASLYIEAENEDPFSGSVVVGDEEYPFDYNPKKESPVKEMEI